MSDSHPATMPARREAVGRMFWVTCVDGWEGIELCGYMGSGLEGVGSTM